MLRFLSAQQVVLTSYFHGLDCQKNKLYLKDTLAVCAANVTTFRHRPCLHKPYFLSLHNEFHNHAINKAMYHFNLCNLFMLIPTKQYSSVNTEIHAFSSIHSTLFHIENTSARSSCKNSSQVRALLSSTTSCYQLLQKQFS